MRVQFIYKLRLSYVILYVNKMLICNIERTTFTNQQTEVTMRVLIALLINFTFVMRINKTLSYVPMALVKRKKVQRFESFK